MLCKHKARVKAPKNKLKYYYQYLNDRHTLRKCNHSSTHNKKWNS